MNWNKITDPQQLSQIKEESAQQPILIFKHSISCSTSATALARLERKWNQEEVGHLKPYYLDLVRFRPISNAIAEKFEVEHESPQVLIIQNGKTIYHESHWGIDYEKIKEILQTV